MTAEPMLGSSFRSGSWVAVRVTVENSGPAVNGVLRLSSGANASTFALPVELPSGSRQAHLLYGQAGPLNGRFDVSLESGDTVVASQRLSAEPDATRKLRIYVVAERPEALVGALRSAGSAGSAGATDGPEVVAIAPEDLPPRVEPWSSIDVLVWQDMDTNRLQAEQTAALRTWLGLGGHAMFVGGSTGATRLGAIPSDLLPYQPAAVVDVQPAELQPLLGTNPAGATAVPAVAGPLERGVVLASSGDTAVAARTTLGQGSVSLIGFDPTTDWIVSSGGAVNLWTGLLPTAPNAIADRLGNAPDDGFIVNALSAIPSVTLPRLDQLFVLLAAYILTIGPINYLILRRRDRREWAWLTMPATIAAFAVVTYVFGVGLRGSSTAVNELAIVRGATGTDRGVAQVHVGVYSPSRAGFDVRVAGRPVISSQNVNNNGDFNGGGFGQQRQPEPLAVELGEPAVIRGFQVGFGSMRTFQAEAEVATPRIETDLTLVGDTLSGTLQNASDEAVLDVAIVYGSGVQLIGELAPGAPVQINLKTTALGGRSMSDRLVPGTGETDPDSVRRLTARRSIIQHLAGGWNDGFGQQAAQVFGSGPVVLVWRSGNLLDVDLGASAQQGGETLFVISARAAIEGPTSFSGGLMRGTTLAMDAVEAYEEGASYVVNQGTIAVEYRPMGLEGVFNVTGLKFRLASESASAPGPEGTALVPLPASEQPPSDDPLLADPRPDEGAADVPRIQLFDLQAQRWIEMEPVARSQTYSVSEPASYVDGSGAFRVRFVARDANEYAQFTFSPRLDGTVE